MGKDEALQFLAHLRLAVRPVTLSAAEVQEQLKLYRQHVLEFPADIGRKVLREMIETKDFWPTINELRCQMQDLVTRRHQVLDAFRRGQTSV